MIKDIDKIKNILNKKVVMTNGCFDILHEGHLHYLKKAKKLGDVLIVAINSDDSVRKLKGKKRPINKLEVRIKNLENLGFINFIIPFSSITPIGLIKEIKPNILVKGSDYKVEDIVGFDFVKSYGGIVDVIDYVEGYSTSGIISAKLN